MTNMSHKIECNSNTANSGVNQRVYTNPENEGEISSIHTANKSLGGLVCSIYLW